MPLRESEPQPAPPPPAVENRNTAAGIILIFATTRSIAIAYRPLVPFPNRSTAVPSVPPFPTPLLTGKPGGPFLQSFRHLRTHHASAYVALFIFVPPSPSLSYDDFRRTTYPTACVPARRRRSRCDGKAKKSTNGGGRRAAGMRCGWPAPPLPCSESVFPL